LRSLRLVRRDRLCDLCGYFVVIGFATFAVSTS